MVVLHVPSLSIGGNVSIILSLLSLSPKRKMECYNRYFDNRHVFHIEKYGYDRKVYNNEVCVMG